MPPNHWVTARHMRIPLGQDSMSPPASGSEPITVDPDVVNPDTDSKNASARSSLGSPNKYGRLPTRPHRSQPRPTTTIPSRRGTRSILPIPHNIITPPNAATMIAERNNALAAASLPSVTSSLANSPQAAMAMLTSSSNAPRNLDKIRKFMIQKNG